MNILNIYKDMKPITKTYLLLFTCLLLLAACQKEEDLPTPYTETVQLIISVPASASTRIGDPGTAVAEGADWDRLAVILAYTDDSEVTLPNGSMVQVETLSKDDFENLPFYSNTQYRLLAIDAQPGTVYIYGVTYSSDAAQSPELDIKECIDNDGVQALTISNDYASTSQNAASKFVSVATGYYKTTGNQPDEFTIQEGGTGQVGGTIPTMTLTRLAAKIDIQWDAADAYEAGYTDVKVTGFKYNGTAQGRLFPDLSTSNYSPTTATKEFYNTSEISQRNGRVYHYTFPDGEIDKTTSTTTPNVTFNITAKKSGATIPDNGYTYTLNFQEALKQATWYKVNAMIKGITGDGNITFGDNSGTSAGS